MPILMVVAVSPMSLPAAAEPAGEAAVVPGAAVADAAEPEEVVLDADPVDELLELQPAISRTAASAPITPSRRTRARSGRAGRVPGLSLLAVTLVSFDFVRTGHYKKSARGMGHQCA